VFSASKNHGAKKKTQLLSAGGSTGPGPMFWDVWKPVFASENLIRAVHHFFHQKRTCEKRLQMQLEDFRIFFGQFWR